MSSYFDQYADFNENNTAPVMDELRRLSRTRGWGSKRYRQEKRRCLSAALQDIFNEDEHTSKIEVMQGLCAELGIIRVPESITKCRQVLRSISVNLIDLIDANRAGTAVRIFQNKHQLANYTHQTERYFPKDIAKDKWFSDLLKDLM